MFPSDSKPLIGGGFPTPFSTPVPPAPNGGRDRIDGKPGVEPCCSWITEKRGLPMTSAPAFSTKILCPDRCEPMTPQTPQTSTRPPVTAYVPPNTSLSLLAHPEGVARNPSARSDPTKAPASSWKIAWIAGALVTLLVLGASGSAVAQAPASVGTEFAEIAHSLVSQAEAEGALSPETAAALHATIDTGEWHTKEARELLGEIAEELSAADAPQDELQLRGSLDRVSELAVSPRLPTVGYDSSQDHQKLDPVQGPALPSGDPSCQQDCLTEYNWCYTLCFLGYLVCIGGTSGWGALACFFMFLVCISHCEEAYKICMRRCEDPPEIQADAAGRGRSALLPFTGSIRQASYR